MMNFDADALEMEGALLAGAGVCGGRETTKTFRQRIRRGHVAFVSDRRHHRHAWSIHGARSLEVPLGGSRH